MKWKEITLATAAFIATSFVITGSPLAITNDQDPNCPIIMQLQRVAKYIDLHNSVCASEDRMCVVVNKRLDQLTASTPGILSVKDGTLYLDTSSAITLLKASKIGDSIRNCESGNCSKEISVQSLVENDALNSSEKDALLMTLPLSNISRDID